ncbi:MAG: hypothetical protein WC283_03365 [Candidatus Paceibacterota bacterium]|jgi:hypothetical protein
MSKRNQIIASICIIIFVPALIMFMLGAYFGKIPGEYVIFLQFLIFIIIDLATIYLVIKLHKEKSKLWILGAIILLLMFLRFFPLGEMIDAIINFINSILVLVFVIKLTKWQKNKNKLKKIK